MSDTPNPRAEQLVEDTTHLPLHDSSQSIGDTTAKTSASLAKIFQTNAPGSKTVSPPYTLCESYVQNGDEETGAEAVKSITASLLTTEEARNILACLARKTSQLQCSNDIYTAVLQQQYGPTAFASLAGDDEQTFKLLVENLCECKGSVLSLLTSILLEDRYWISFENCRFSTITKVSYSLVHSIHQNSSISSELILQCLVRLLVTYPNQVVNEVRPEYFDDILLLLRPETPAKSRSQATLFILKYIEISTEKGRKFLTEFVVTRVSRQTTDDLITAFSVAATTFPILPTVSAGLFLTENFVDDLLRIVIRSKSYNLMNAVLDLLSAACIDSTCREVLNKKCSQWLLGVASSTHEKQAVLAALILTKARGVGGVTGGEVNAGKNEDQRLVPTFMRFLGNSDADIVQNAMEGLAYASIKFSVKKDLTGNSSFLKTLFTILKDSTTRPSTLFGGWTVLSNLTAYPPAMSAEQQQLSDLKAYANVNRPGSDDSHDDDHHVTERCKNLVAASLIPVLVYCSKKATSSIIPLIAVVVLSLTKYPKHRGFLVQQGIMDTLIRFANMSADPASPIQIACRQCKVALARILISVNPSLLFQKLPVESAILPLTDLINPVEEVESNFKIEASRNVEPVFESLRALTNLASMDERTRVSITDRAFGLIVSQLWSSNVAIIQAATECILNLTVSQYAASKFFLVPIPDVLQAGTSSVSNPLSNKNSAPVVQPSSQSNNTLHLLSALTHSASPGTRRAATASIAHILAWGEAVTAYLALEKGVETLVSVIIEAVSEADIDWLIRGTMAILLLLTTEVEATEDSDVRRKGKVPVASHEAKRRVKKAGGEEIFLAMKSSDLGQNEDVSDMIEGILAALKE